MKIASLFAALFLTLVAGAQADSFYLLKPDRVFDGRNMHTDWIVLVKGRNIEAAGPMQFKLPANTRIIELPGTTLLPGLIEGHAHLFYILTTKFPGTTRSSGKVARSAQPGQ